MRLAGQAKMGFYPCPPEVLDELCKHLKVRPPNPEKKYDTINILDPCAGEGEAIQRIATLLGVQESQVYTVELDATRSARILERMPSSRHIGPATFLHGGVQITGYSFGLAYVNPPFDDEFGGGKREELAFVEEATRKLITKGILVLVCPFRTLNGSSRFCEFLDSHYEDIAVYSFPSDHRRFNEIALIGRKRKEPLSSQAVYEHGCLQKMQFRWSGYIQVGDLPPLGCMQPKQWSGGRPSYERETELRVWEIPHSWKPNSFSKVKYTDDELDADIAASPLADLLDEVTLTPPPQPPLPLDKGHLGLCLASGMLDGYVADPWGGHIVRGASHKVVFHNKEQSKSEVNPESGAVTTKDVYSERPVTIIRAVGQRGVIMTYSNEAKEKTEDDDDGPGLEIEEATDRDMR